MGIVNRKAPMEIVNRFSNSRMGWSYTSQQPDAIDFQTSVSRILRGIGIFTGDHLKGKETHTGEIKIYEEGKQIMMGLLSFDNSEKKIFSYYLDSPILIKSQCRYSVSIRLNGHSTFNGCESKITEINFKTKGKITFFPSSLSTNGTSIESGQIPEFYFM